MLKELIKEFRIADCPEFKRTIMQRCGRSINQYYDRYNGRTKLTTSEREIIMSVLESILV